MASLYDLLMAMYSGSQLDIATIVFFLEHQMVTDPAIMNTYAIVDFRSETSTAQSESL